MHSSPCIPRTQAGSDAYSSSCIVTAQTSLDAHSSPYIKRAQAGSDAHSSPCITMAQTAADAQSLVCRRDLLPRRNPNSPSPDLHFFTQLISSPPPTLSLFQPSRSSIPMRVDSLFVSKQQPNEVAQMTTKLGISIGAAPMTVILPFSQSFDTPPRLPGMTYLRGPTSHRGPTIVHPRSSRRRPPHALISDLGLKLFEIECVSSDKARVDVLGGECDSGEEGGRVGAEVWPHVDLSGGCRRGRQPRLHWAEADYVRRSYGA